MHKLNVTCKFLIWYCFRTIYTWLSTFGRKWWSFFFASREVENDAGFEWTMHGSRCFSLKTRQISLISNIHGWVSSEIDMPTSHCCFTPTTKVQALVQIGLAGLCVKKGLIAWIFPKITKLVGWTQYIFETWINTNPRMTVLLVKRAEWSW